MAASEGEIKSMTSATERLDLSGQMDALAWLAGLMAAEGSPVSGLHYLLAQFVTTGIVMLWSFWANKLWTFAEPRGS